MSLPSSLLITPLSRELIARMVITPQRTAPAAVTATALASPFSTIARLTISSL